MPEEQTAAEYRKEYLDNLGPQLGPIFSELRDDWAWLQIKWSECIELYGTSTERIELLNSAAGSLFQIVEYVMWEDTLLHLCRLTDPATMGKNQNLSIQALPELCVDTAIHEEVKTLVNQAVEATSFARDWRNRHIAHRDRRLALGLARPLEPANRKKVSSAITAIHGVLNIISEKLMNSTLGEDVISPSSNAEALLYVIRDGLKADAERRERISSRKFTADDLRHDPV